MKTICPLFDKPFYSYTISLSGANYGLTFRYSSRIDGYLMSIEDAEENPIIKGIHLVPFYPLTYQHSLVAPQGEFLLLPLEDVPINRSSIPNPREVHKTHYLVYDDFED